MNTEIDDFDDLRETESGISKLKLKPNQLLVHRKENLTLEINSP